MNRALVAFGFLACLASAGAAVAQTRDRSTAARELVNTAGSVPIPRNVEPSCNVSREQVRRADGRLEWQTRTDCMRDPY